MNVSAETVTVERLEEIAIELWSQSPHGSVIWLTGDLGSGKTTFAQGVVKAAGGEDARSPSFALVNHYTSPAGLLIHVDCYRLRDPAEAIDLDFPELQREARLVLVEWPEKAGEHAPEPGAHLRFSHTGKRDERRVERLL